MASLSLSSVDVYALAKGVRDEFEKVIDSVGNEPVILLVAKVVEVLQHLENLTHTVETERLDLEELKLTVEKMKSTEAMNNAEKEHLRQEKEVMEHEWKTEVKQLTEYAAKMEEENSRLRITVDDLENQDNAVDREELSQLMKEIILLRDKVSNQRDDLRSLKREMSQKETEVEALQSQLDRFTKLNADYRNRNSLSNRQIQELLEEKAELEQQLHEKAPANCVQMRRRTPKNDGVNGRLHAINRSSGSCDSYEDWLKMLDLEGKVIIDLNNPDRPRYSVTEMRKVIQDRNELKAQLFEVKEELSMYKPLAVSSVSKTDEEPVQGPINREPDEKLYPEKFKKSSGIQRLFHSFLKT